MDNSAASDSDTSENDDSDTLVRDYLNDTRVESAASKHRDMSYTPEQLENIALYKSAIALNSETQNMYKKLEESLVQMLIEVRRKLKENEAALIKHSRQYRNTNFNYLNCGKPYFKDKDGFTPPDNSDTIMMRQADMYDFSLIGATPGWTSRDKSSLVTALLEFSREIKKKEYKSQIDKLRKEDPSENLLEIARLERAIAQLQHKTLAEIALPLDQEYDWDDVANSLNNRHTALEYRALWKLFLHPSINKSTWNRTEHKNLQKIVAELNSQDWNAIARRLNTGRTGYQCFVYYRTNLSDNMFNSKWNPEEIEYLQRVIDFYREGTYIPWSKVACAMDGRTKIQVYNKYTRILERRKGRFLEEEDIIIMNAYDKYGSNFKKIAQFLPGRSAAQIKTRFSLISKLKTSSTTWTVEEDKKLLQVMSNSNPGCNYSNAAAHFPGKDRFNIRSRYITLKKWMSAHPAVDISCAPRRRARRLLYGHGSYDLKDAIVKLNNRIENELETKRKTLLTVNSSELDIENGIITLLVNEKFEERNCETKTIDESEPLVPGSSTHEMSTTNLHNLLMYFMASLDKTKFQNSVFASKYPSLGKTTSQIQVKSYSKTANVHTVKRNNMPDIWDEKTCLKHCSYVLPPNYATLTGCRVLMKHYGENSGSSDAHTLSAMIGRNKCLKNTVETLKERMTGLFMWPILLSNELPKKALTNTPCTSAQPPPKKERICLPKPTGVTIPTGDALILKKKSKLMASTNDDIDEPKNSEECIEIVSRPSSRMGQLNYDTE